jgi:hypothetical protein
MSRARPDLPELPGVVPGRMVNEFAPVTSPTPGALATSVQP